MMQLLSSYLLMLSFVVVLSIASTFVNGLQSLLSDLPVTLNNKGNADQQAAGTKENRPSQYALPSLLQDILTNRLDLSKATCRYPPIVIPYSIFQGFASIRHLDSLIGQESSDPNLVNMLLHTNTTGSDKQNHTVVSLVSKTARAISVLLLKQRDYKPRGNETGQLVAFDHLLADVAHEILLGVTGDNLPEAEFAATHPGQTDWSQRPENSLSDTNDMVHSILHRLEASNIGEGGQTGWENAKYWAAGGPKQKYRRNDDDAIDAGKSNEGIEEIRHDQSRVPASNQHVVHQALALVVAEMKIQQQRPQLARTKHPSKESITLLTGDQSVGLSLSSLSILRVVSANERREYSILAAGGKRRLCVVQPGCWDPFLFLDLIQATFLSAAKQHCTLHDDCDKCQVGSFPGNETETRHLCRDLEFLQILELLLVLRYELILSAMPLSSNPDTTISIRDLLPEYMRKQIVEHHCKAQ